MKSIKIGLDALGYNVSNENENYDSELESAVKSFQQDHNLNDDGIFTDKTTEKFIDLMRNKIQKEDIQLDDTIKYIHQ